MALRAARGWQHVAKCVIGAEHASLLSVLGCALQVPSLLFCYSEGELLYEMVEDPVNGTFSFLW